MIDDLRFAFHQMPPEYIRAIFFVILVIVSLIVAKILRNALWFLVGLGATCAFYAESIKWFVDNYLR